jgi:carbamoylphosphate synthase large subunit
MSIGAMVQIPRFAFEKFPGAKPELTTQMKSVGEAMAMGRTFQESFQKVHVPPHLSSPRCWQSLYGTLTAFQ